MATYSTNELKAGVKVMIGSEPCSVIDHEFNKPGKGQAFTRVKLRNLKTGRVIDRTFKSGETIEAADAIETQIQYLYFDGSNYVFMATDGSCEQYDLSSQVVGEAVNWLQAEINYTAIIWNGEVINIALPTSVELEIVEAEPSVKGDTVSGGSKMVTLTTGAKIRVPLFVKAGETVKVNPTTKEYLGRI